MNRPSSFRQRGTAVARPPSRIDPTKKKKPGSQGFPASGPREENLDTQKSRSATIVGPNPIGVNQ
jgi:hypothetical protein